MENLQLQEFQQEHIPELLEFINDSYAQNHPIFTDKGITQEEFRQETELVVRLSIWAAKNIKKTRQKSIMFNTFVKQNGVMISATFNCDIDFYINQIEPMINTKELLSIRHLLPAAEKGVYAFRNCVRKEYQRSKIFTFHFDNQRLHLSNNGYDYVFAFLTNPITLNPLLLGGGKIVQKKMRLYGSKEYQTKAIVMKCSEIVKILGAIGPKL